MTNKFAAKFTIAQHKATERMADRERGASALEYVGMVLVAAMVVTAVYAGFTGLGLETKVGNAISDILNGPVGGEGGEGSGT